MDGLTKIISKIECDANMQCEHILQKANADAQRILDNAEKSAKMQCEQILSKAENEAGLILEKASSASELAVKRIMLETKCDIIKNVTDEALLYLCELPSKEYFNNIMHLVKSNALSGEGQMFFNEIDFNRLPKDFEKTVNEVIGKDKSIKVSSEQISCKGGFVLSYPEMRVDCTFESLIEDSFEIIRDKLNEVLFS